MLDLEPVLGLLTMDQDLLHLMPGHLMRIPSHLLLLIRLVLPPQLKDKLQFVKRQQVYEIAPSYSRAAVDTSIEVVVASEALGILLNGAKADSTRYKNIENVML